jgi:hypothetical protein
VTSLYPDLTTPFEPIAVLQKDALKIWSGNLWAHMTNALVRNVKKVIEKNMKNLDDYYKDWSGVHHTINSCHPVHDSSEACDFAEYYNREKIENMKNRTTSFYFNKFGIKIVIFKPKYRRRYENV